LPRNPVECIRERRGAAYTDTVDALAQRRVLDAAQKRASAAGPCHQRHAGRAAGRQQLAAQADFAICKQVSSSFSREQTGGAGQRQGQGQIESGSVLAQ